MFFTFLPSGLYYFYREISQLSLEKWELQVNVTKGIMQIYPPKFQIHQNYDAW